jgi:hydrogenase expression/formation protein HypE
MAIMCAREGLELETAIESDSEPLHDLVREMLEAVPSIHCLRDLTRGGLSSCLNELAEVSGVGIEIDEARVPVHPHVKAACEILGLDPLYVACEGRLVAIVPERAADELVKVMRSHPTGTGSSVIGRVVGDHPGRVVLKSRIGGRRILDRLSGEQLPRIC